MEIFTLLETIEDMLENSKEVPFTHKAIIDKEEVLDIIKEIRLKLPEELKQAKVIKEEHDRIISKANEEASEIVKEAENRIISMIDEHEITRKAYEQKNKIIEMLTIWLEKFLMEQRHMLITFWLAYKLH